MAHIRTRHYKEKIGLGRAQEQMVVDAKFPLPSVVCTLNIAIGDSLWNDHIFKYKN